ncbi:MAG: glycosyltransferase family 39 protein, partial [Acidobacteriota bacterium]
MSTRRLTWLAFVILFAARLALACAPAVPRQLDELGYLAGARFLATGEGALEPEGRAPYKVGYSLLLVPFFWLEGEGGGGVDTVFFLTRLLGAFLMASLLPLGAALAGRFEPGLGAGERVALGAAVALSPAAVLYGTTAMSENVLLPGYLLYLLCAARAFEEGSWSRWAAWGAVAGGLYLVHERAIGWLVLAGAACLIDAVIRRRWTPLAGLAAAASLVFVRLPVPGSAWSTGSSAAGYLSELLARPETLLATVVGHVWYLALASGGLLAGGLYLALWGRRPSPLVGLTLLSASSMVGLSVVLMGQRENARMTHWIYGRYSESVLPALVLLALGALCVQARRRRWRTLLPAAGLSALTLVLPPLLLR